MFIFKRFLNRWPEIIYRITVLNGGKTIETFCFWFREVSKHTKDCCASICTFIILFYFQFTLYNSNFKVYWAFFAYLFISSCWTIDWFTIYLIHIIHCFIIDFWKQLYFQALNKYTISNQCNEIRIIILKINNIILNYASLQLIFIIILIVDLGHLKSFENVSMAENKYPVDQKKKKNQYMNKIQGKVYRTY